MAGKETIFDKVRAGIQEGKEHVKHVGEEAGVKTAEGAIGSKADDALKGAALGVLTWAAVTGYRAWRDARESEVVAIGRTSKGTIFAGPVREAVVFKKTAGIIKDKFTGENIKSTTREIAIAALAGAAGNMLLNKK